MDILHPVRIGDCHQTLFGFETIEVLAAALAVDLRRRGFSLAQVTEITNWVRVQTLCVLQRHWEQGRTLLLCVGDNQPFPKLLTRAEVFENTGIDLAAALTAGVAVAVIDTEEAYRQLVEQIGEGEGHGVAGSGAAAG
jgi:hypothetical protein